MRDEKPGRVVVGIDATPAGYQALRYAVERARRDGVTLVAVRAHGYPSQAVPWIDELAAAAIAEVARVFAEAMAGQPADVDITVTVAAGRPARVLLDVADRDGDVLVIGGCGPRRLLRRRRALIARQCARVARCPVVIVPPTALARSAPQWRLARHTTHTAAEFLHTASVRPF
jgi:nucleotide-binding universal stress UspA family protein